MSAPLHPGIRAEGAPIRLMVVDDSIVVRSVFETMLAQVPDLRIVATASSADQALAKLADTPVDIVLLDVAMPGMDGLTALPEILRRSDGARVLIVSASAGEGADACVRALTLGAADTLEKPRAGSFGESFRAELVDRLRRIAREGRVVRCEKAHPSPAPATAPVTAALLPQVGGPIGCIAIGASTGGLHALSAFFKALPVTCDIPILITQHLPASFMPYFAAQMRDIAGRPTEVAGEGSALRNGAILVAPGNAHIRLRTSLGGVRVRLDREAAPSGCMPSVDPMLESVAEIYGGAAFAVVLSGMGRDGALGARNIVTAGGEIAVQDRMTSVVWGMPGSIATAGLASTIASPAGCAGRIADRLEGRIARRAAWK